jgi:hypothetical protein
MRHSLRADDGHTVRGREEDGTVCAPGESSARRCKCLWDASADTEGMVVDFLRCVLQKKARGQDELGADLHGVCQCYCVAGYFAAVVRFAHIRRDLNTKINGFHKDRAESKSPGPRANEGHLVSVDARTTYEANTNFVHLPLAATGY